MQSTNQHAASPAPAVPHLSGPAELDEAFAELPDLAIRIDAAQRAGVSRNYVAETERLVAKIGEQVKALDAQRARLARMLGDLDISPDL